MPRSSRVGPITSPISCIPRWSSWSVPTPGHARRSNARGSMTPTKSSATSSTTFTVITGRAKEPPRRRFRLRRRHVLRALAAVLALVLIYLFIYEPRYGGTLVVRAPRPLVFAHRGFGDHAPDNSLYAVEHALDVDMDGVDVDGQLTRDGELIIFHDLSVDRLTSG